MEIMLVIPARIFRTALKSLTHTHLMLSHIVYQMSIGAEILEQSWRVLLNLSAQPPELTNDLEVMYCF